MKSKLTVILLIFLLVGCNIQSNSEQKVENIVTEQTNEQDITDTQQNSSDILSDSEAKEILKELMPKAINIYAMFNGCGTFEDDPTKTIPNESEYTLIVDEKVKSIADIKKVVEEVFTKDCAEKTFYSIYLEMIDRGLPLYKDYEGQLYQNSSNGGKGWATEFLLDTAKVKNQEDNVVEIEVEKTVLDDPADNQIITIKDVNDKWLICESFA